MIRVQLVKSGKHIEGFQISGHAEYAPSGQDIVCAAASFLATTVVNSLELQLGVAGTVKSEDGYLYYRLPASLNEQQQHTAQIILQTAFDRVSKFKRSVSQIYFYTEFEN